MPLHPNATGEIDRYISELPEFSRNICVRLRSIITSAAPGILEDWKWGPNFNCNGMVCGFGAFKKHVVLQFFNGAQMSDQRGLFNHGMDNDHTRGIHITSIDQINEKYYSEYVKESVSINKAGYKKKRVEKEVACPDDLRAALRRKPAALTFFDSLTSGYRNEFVEHVSTAKRQDTREARIGKVVELCASGQRLHDRYKK